jgi:hypothetical protein
MDYKIGGSQIETLVSLSPAQAQAQPIGKAKVAIISTRFLFFPRNKNRISSQIDENK